MNIGEHSLDHLVNLPCLFVVRFRTVHSAVCGRTLALFQEPFIVVCPKITKLMKGNDDAISTFVVLCSVLIAGHAARLPGPPIFTGTEHYPSICYLPPGTIRRRRYSIRRRTAFIPSSSITGCAFRLGNGAVGGRVQPPPPCAVGVSRGDYISYRPDIPSTYRQLHAGQT